MMSFQELNPSVSLHFMLYLLYLDGTKLARHALQRMKCNASFTFVSDALSSVSKTPCIVLLFFYQSQSKRRNNTSEFQNIFEPPFFQSITKMMHQKKEEKERKSVYKAALVAAKAKEDKTHNITFKFFHVKPQQQQPFHATFKALYNSRLKKPGNILVR